MAQKIQYITDQKGDRVGIYLPLKEWNALLAGDQSVLQKYRRRKKKRGNVELPEYDLGCDYMPSREDLYNELLTKEKDNF